MDGKRVSSQGRYGEITAPEALTGAVARQGQPFSRRRGERQRHTARRQRQRHPDGGDDILDGGAGNDILSGDLGVDLARYTNATGSITANLTTGMTWTRQGIAERCGILDGLKALLQTSTLAVVMIPHLFGQRPNAMLEPRGERALSQA